MDAEGEILGMQGMTLETARIRYPWSIVSYREIPAIRGRYRICIADWECILDMLQPLGVKKVALLGKKLIGEANQYMRYGQESSTEYGFLWNHEYRGYSVPFYGLPITRINDEAVATYQMLKQGVLF